MRYKALNNQILEYNRSHNIDTLSVDIFDTLLLRNTKPEFMRFYEVAHLHEKYFQKHNRHISHECCFCARLLAHKTGYKTAPLVEKCRDASLQHIFNLYLTVLGLPVTIQTIEELIRIELNYEKQNLKINNNLYAIIKDFSHSGGKIYLLSDMYFAKMHLQNLLEHFSANQFISGIYVSNQFSVSKSCGELFRVFIDMENLQPAHILHIGDNIYSDKLMPESIGIRAFHIPQKFFIRCISFARKKIFLRKIRDFLP